jgi:hypothetical protein
MTKRSDIIPMNARAQWAFSSIERRAKPRTEEDSQSDIAISDRHGIQDAGACESRGRL